MTPDDATHLMGQFFNLEHPSLAAWLWDLELAKHAVDRYLACGRHFTDLTGPMCPPAGSSTSFRRTIFG